MKILYTVVLICLITGARAQELASLSIPEVRLEAAVTAKTTKSKPISYTAIGYLAPLDRKDIVVGGTTAVFKRFGTFLAYKVGIKNFMMPEHGQKGDVYYDNVKENGWTITANTQEAVTFMLSGGLTFCIWKKMPIYVGAGMTRYRAFFEYIDPIDNKPKWNVNPDRTRIELNYTAGFFVPLFGRLLLNVGYDHNPQSVFIGLGLRGIYAYEDIDEWK